MGAIWHVSSSLEAEMNTHLSRRTHSGPQRKGDRFSTARKKDVMVIIVTLLPLFYRLWLNEIKT